MAHVFISYCRTDTQFAELLERNLARAGFATWMDHDLPAGSSWRSEIDKALSTADSILLVMSPAGNFSAYVSYEWAFSLGAGVRVIPLLLGLQHGELHSRLAELQWLDFSDPPKHPWNKLFAVLREPRSQRQVVEQAARSLSSLVSQERKNAVRTLAEMDDSSAREILAGAVHHPMREVRVEAAQALAAMKDPRAIPGLLEAICNAYSWDYESAAAKIGVAAIPELFKALGHSDAGIRYRACELLGLIKSESAIPGLRGAVCDSDAIVRAGALQAFGRIGSPHTVDTLIAGLDDDSTYVRAAAVEALGRVRSSGCVTGLLKGLNDKDEAVRSKAASQLEGSDDATVIAALTDRVLNEKSSDARRSAAYALSTSKHPAAMTGLLACFESDELLFNSTLLRLVEIGGADVIAGLMAIVRNPNSGGRVQAAHVLGMIGDTSAMPALVEALSDSSDPVREAAAGALGKVGRSDAVVPLQGVLRDRSPQVRAAAASGLGATGDSSAVPTLIEAINDAKSCVRRAAAQALAGIADPSTVAALAEALDDDDATVRSSAIEGLEQINNADARAALKAFRRRRATAP